MVFDGLFDLIGKYVLGEADGHVLEHAVSCACKLADAETRMARAEMIRASACDNSESVCGGCVGSAFVDELPAFDNDAAAETVSDDIEETSSEASSAMAANDFDEIVETEISVAVKEAPEDGAMVPDTAVEEYDVEPETIVRESVSAVFESVDDDEDVDAEEVSFESGNVAGDPFEW